MPKKATNKKVNRLLTNDVNFMLPETHEAFRALIKKITHEELQKFRKEDLQHIYDKAKEV